MNLSLFRKMGAAAMVAVATGFMLVGTASAQTPAIPTEISDGVDDVQANLLLYPALLVGAAVAIGVAFLSVKVAPKVIKWLSNRFGG